jgi:hypothetical protein
MRIVALLLSAFAAVTVSAESPARPPHAEISTWVLLKLTQAGCTVRADAAAMNGMQGRIRESLTEEQYASITDQTLYLASDCNTRQAVAEAALLERAAGSSITLTPVRMNRSTAVYRATDARDDVSALVALTPLGEMSGVAVITMAGSGP